MEIGIILGISFGAPLLLILLAILYRKSLLSNKGILGEKRVEARLNKYIHKKGGYLVNDVILPGKNDRTSEIDHILFAKVGLFVVETKNISGLVYGKEDEEYWTQVLGNGNTKNQLYNPVKQNSTHVNRVKDILNITNDDYIHNIVVFNQNNTRYIKSHKVFKIRKLLKHLYKYKDEIYTEDAIKEMYQKIKYYADHPIISKEEHIKRIQDLKDNK